jgi:hypothetical protein
MMNETKKFPSVILSMYGFNHIPVHREVFKKREYEKQKLKRIKAAYEAKMRQAGREHKAWNREYIVFTNTLN